jgi:PEP-CTERM motif
MKRLLLAATGLCALAVPAMAANQTFDVVFESHDYVSAFGQAIPVNLAGEFHITFDQTKEYFSETKGITLDSINILLDSPLSFTYSPTGVVGDTNAFELAVGGSEHGATFVQEDPPTNDFELFIVHFGGIANFRHAAYSQSNGLSFFGPALFFTDDDRDGTVRITEIIGSGTGVGGNVPEPATWAMIIAGFGLMAGLGLYRTRRVPISIADAA